MILLWLLLKHKGAFSNTHIALLFTAKIAGTFALQWLFTYYYTERSTADIYRFFDDGIMLNEVFFTNPYDYLKILSNTYSDDSGFNALYFEKMNAWIKPDDSAFYNDNRFMIKVNSLLAFISFGYYEIHGIIFSALSFIGTKWCVESLIKERNNQDFALSAAILFPSSLLWMSGGLKEAVLMFGIGAFLKVNFVHFRFSLKSIILSCLAVLILISVKIYFIAALIPAYFAFTIVYKSRSNYRVQAAVWAAIIIAGISFSHFIGFDLAEYTVRKQHDFLNHVQVISPGSAFEMTYLKDGYLSILASVPQSFANVLFRPYIYEVKTMPEVLMLFENVIISIFLVLSIMHIIRAGKLSKNQTLIILFILPILILTGLVTPVFGAIMRYRAPAIVLLLITMSPYIQPFLRRINHSRQ